MMKVYLEEYINSDIYDLLKNRFELIKDKSIAEAVISRILVIDKAFLDECPKLKYVAAYGTGVDAIDLLECKKRGIVVFNAPGQNCNSVAELNVCLMLGISRHIEEGIINTKEKGIIDYNGMLGNEISGKTVGFIGIGKISLLTAKMLKYGFGMRSIGYNRTKKNNPDIEEFDIEYVLKESDYVVMGLALNDETYGFINLEKLKLMKKSAYLINATRGALINHDDLVYALSNKIIKGYASDVFEVEPIDINDPLLKENVLSTPHVGGNTVESLYRVGHLVYEELVEIEEGKEPKFRII